MKIDWRISAITAGSAFLLSVVIGVIGNVSFGVLILRAVTAAVLFGAGAIGVTIVIDRYLPELRRASATSPTANTVDIVVEGDDELEAVVGGMDENGEEGGATGIGVEELSVDESDGVLEEVEERGGSGETMTDATGGDVEEIEEIASGDELPNVDSMADSFTEIPLGEDPGAESLDSGEDPALMARAIRTVLKREE